MRYHADTADEASEILQRVGTLPLELVDSRPHRALALDLATRFHPSAYDCLYAAVALAIDCQVVTADRAFFNNLRKAYPRTMLWVEDIADPAEPAPEPAQ
jgi:predicted nucleic acid-binding protein